MKKISKLLLIFVVSIFGIVSLTGCNKKQETQDKLTIVSTNFPSYDSDKYVGKKIKVRGFAVRKGLPYLPSGYFAIGKYIISCCAADAGFGGFYAKYDLYKVKENTWYEIEGILEKTQDTEGYNILAIKVININELDGNKEEQYAYPCYSYDDGSCSIMDKYDLENKKTYRRSILTNWSFYYTKRRIIT